MSWWGEYKLPSMATSAGYGTGTMYASEPAVRSLAANVRTALSTADILAVGANVNAEIDAILAQHFEWPTRGGVAINDPPPAMVVVAANYLTAGWVESQKFSVNEAGLSVLNPYARRLMEHGYGVLQQIADGKISVPELVRFTEVAQSAPPDAFYPAVSVGGGRRR